MTLKCDRFLAAKSESSKTPVAITLAYPINYDWDVALNRNAVTCRATALCVSCTINRCYSRLITEKQYTMPPLTEQLFIAL